MLGARPAGADERDLARRLEPLDARVGERARGEVRLDRRARDERDAVAGGDGAPHRLLQAELEPHVEVAQPGARAAQLVLDHLAARRRPPASGSAARRAARRASTVRPANAWPGGHARITSSRKNGSNTTPRCRRAAPTTPSSSSRSATSSTTCCVSETESATRDAGVAPLELAEEQADDGAARARRGADLERAAELALLARRRPPRGAAPRARAAAARRGRGAGPPRSARRAGRSGRAAACPSRFSSARTCRLTAGCVTPSRSAACEKLLPLDDRAERRELTRVHKDRLCLESHCRTSVPTRARSRYAHLGAVAERRRRSEGRRPRRASTL